MSTIALTYRDPSERGEYGVDLVARDDGEPVAWGWWPARGATAWDTAAADAHLATLGWRRTSDWTAEDWSGVEDVHSAPVERVP